MSLIAVPVSTFLPNYVPFLDRAVSPVAETLRNELRRGTSSNSWTEQGREIGEDAIASAVEHARARGITVGWMAIELARALVWALPSHVPVPDITVEEDGEIALDWHEASDRNLTLTVNENGFVGYSGLVGLKSDYGRAPFSGSIPDTLVLALLRMYPLPTTSGRPS